MGKKKGFTLAEILVTVLILGVLAAVAIPGFAKAKTKAEKNQAIAYLRTIRTSMRMYYGKWKSSACQVAANCDTAGEIKSTFGAETQLTGYSFSVTTANATATRTSDSKTLILNQDGTWSGTNTPLPSS